MEEIRAEQRASKGVAMGRAFLVQPPNLAAEHLEIKENEIEREKAAFRRAAEQTREALRPLARTNPIFAAHLDMAEDDTLIDGVNEKISKGKNAQWALEEQMEETCSLLESLEDAYLRERAADVRDVCRRIMAILKGVDDDPFRNIKEKVVLFAEELNPSDTAKMDFRYIRGMVTAKGGATSHVAILARSLEIPALLGMEGILEKVQAGEEVILDGNEGLLLLSPDDLQKRVYAEKQEAEKELKRKLKEMNRLPAVTTDGRQVHLYANVGSIKDVEAAKKHGAEGVGLFRSEFLYMESSRFPTEQEQFEIYKKAAEILKKPITIRTLDIGGDKALPYYQFEKEENPFLGWRAIRFCLDMRDVFKTQLKAILRAAAFGDIRIMYPMIVSVEEFRKANELLEECKRELKERGVLFRESISTGIMVETPAAVFVAEELAKEVDFFSIGTNDLTQYILAADRGNQKLTKLYSPFHPAVLRAVEKVIEAGHREGKEVGMCGEFAGDERAVPILVGMGLDEFSMVSNEIAAVRYQVRGLTEKQAKGFAKRVLAAGTEKEVKKLLER
ncbi:phosphoenolpyruvate--protein phosphotransferase [Anaerotignum sp.]|nr:phosphoenolpyruvate--protein phosphotransferase [Anaerotignum sp.]MBQ7758931.1 phosphoenolpyruvate--protein phosphotransferase [Anaerotignum sp.]